MCIALAGRMVLQPDLPNDMPSDEGTGNHHVEEARDISRQPTICACKAPTICPPVLPISRPSDPYFCPRDVNSLLPTCSLLSCEKIKGEAVEVRIGTLPIIQVAGWDVRLLFHRLPINQTPPRPLAHAGLPDSSTYWSSRVIHWAARPPVALPYRTRCTQALWAQAHTRGTPSATERRGEDGTADVAVPSGEKDGRANGDYYCGEGDASQKPTGSRHMLISAIMLSEERAGDITLKLRGLRLGPGVE
ncbi:hypothetical protein C8R45DRAFT_945458 [Mycena sanguinolenta]|nr:hypothetical protein C8R45DRAFT_945458 [Mycena sanguinolenta]